MFIENIEELNNITADIMKLSQQLEEAFNKLKNFEPKVSKEFAPLKQTLSNAH